MNRFDLTGKTALVTGASSGLGAHFAQVLADAGATVVLAARRMDRLEALAAKIGERAIPIALDVTDPDSIAACFTSIQDKTGSAADIIVNNSGLSREGLSTQMSDEDWDTVMDTNLKGVWRVAKAGANAMMGAGKGGSIINIASILGLRVAPGLSAYSASKAAVDHLTRAMALELARGGIRVNAIAPGYFHTEINDEFMGTDLFAKLIKKVPMRRIGQVEELSGPLLLLASDAGAYMTGATLTVDGGHCQMGL